MCKCSVSPDIETQTNVGQPKFHVLVLILALVHLAENSISLIFYSSSLISLSINFLVVQLCIVIATMIWGVKNYKQAFVGPSPDKRKCLIGIGLACLLALPVILFGLLEAHMFSEFFLRTLNKLNYHDSPKIKELLSAQVGDVWFFQDTHIVIAKILFYTLIPLYEEIFFTGFLLNRLLKMFVLPLAVLMHSATFLTFHLHLVTSLDDIINVLYVSFISSLLRIQTGWLGPSFLAHFLCNLGLFAQLWYFYLKVAWAV